MFYGPILTKGLDMFLFEELLDPLLPLQGLPVPLPVRFAAYAVELQVQAGEAIAAGQVAGKDQYTGQQRQLDNASNLGYNLMYQPGGIQV